MTDRLIDDRELSRRTGRARSTLQKDRVAGRGVPYVRLGSLVRYRKSDLESYLASLRTRRSTSEPA
jgi:predicted DNA-binding transcriptional regulator AlpA